MAHFFFPAILGGLLSEGKDCLSCPLADARTCPVTPHGPIQSRAILTARPTAGTNRLHYGASAGLPLSCCAWAKMSASLSSRLSDFVLGLFSYILGGA